MYCGECDRFEFRRDHPLLAVLDTALARVARALIPPSPLAQVGRSMAGALLAGMGVALPSHYDLHRAEFERTGSVLELDRMLRQVKS